jgi:DNA-binding NtrC family response regulator
VNYFAKRASTRFGLPFAAPSNSDLQMLAEYSWPGNIRELGAVIDRAAILGNGKTLEVAISLGLNQPLIPNFFTPIGGLRAVFSGNGERLRDSNFKIVART